MSALVALQVGPATSIQDRGRFGGQRYGLGSAGALDRVGLARANALVGQPMDSPAIEIGPFACRFKVQRGSVRVALSGTERQVSIEGRALGYETSACLHEGEILDIKAARGGVFSYLGIEGGIEGKPIFGSFSVHARLGLGVPFARALVSGDVLHVGSASEDKAEHMLTPAQVERGPIRVILGPQEDYFSAETITAFQTTQWLVSPLSDRMGYRLEGAPLMHTKGHNIVSDGIANGAIQIPGNGQPLVLLADRGTTGGYPKIAVIITADLHRFAQTPVGSRLSFAAVSIEEAQKAHRAFAQMIAMLPQAICPTAAGTCNPQALFSANLAGQAVDAADPIL